MGTHSVTAQQPKYHSMDALGCWQVWAALGCWQVWAAMGCWVVLATPLPCQRWGSGVDKAHLMPFQCTHAALSATRLKYGGLFDASRGVSGMMAAAYNPDWQAL
jgi:hypothetical protein